LAVSVDRLEIRRIAHLARLALDDAELDRLTRDMNDILEHATTLRELGRAAPSKEQGDAPVPLPPAGAPGAETRFGGARDVAAETPHVLRSPPEAFAPRMAEGFFVVPPPPGVASTEVDAQR
jgi:hypothetical protein